jgi:hypothetical protein
MVLYNFINYRPKEFAKLATGDNVVKLFLALVTPLSEYFLIILTEAMLTVA